MGIYTFLYNLLFIPFARLYIVVAKYFNNKIKEREDNYESSMDSVLHLDNSKPTLLFHSSSMGEFEQAKPIIERLKNEVADINIVCSFYSPSGYINQKKYKYADAVVYMPFDSKANAKEFFCKIKPNLVIFVRYDIWHNHILEINRRGCPVWLIDATKPIGKLINSFPLWGFTKFNYNLFEKIYTLSEKDFDFFKSINLKSEVIKSTDTRFDRIIEKVENAKSETIIPRNIFNKNDFILVCGSTWDNDENIIINAVEKLSFDKTNVIPIIVPHEPTDEHISNLRRRLNNPILFSEFSYKLPDNYVHEEQRTIIIDKIGILLNLYSIADAAYIGGGFGDGVHSVTEAAGYSIPVASAPKITNSPDAVNLKNNGALEVVHNDKELYNWLRSLILYKDQREKYGRLSGTYVYKSKGSSLVIVNEIKNKLNK